MPSDEQNHNFNQENPKRTGTTPTKAPEIDSAAKVAEKANQPNPNPNELNQSRQEERNRNQGSRD